MAIDTIKFKRGVKSKLNNLSYGEPAYISDENELYIGTEDGVEKITRNKEVAELSSQLEHIVKKQSRNIIDYGVIGEGDETDLIQNAINDCIDKKIFLQFESNKTYCISKPLIINNLQKNIDFNGCSIKAINSIETVLDINTIDAPLSDNKFRALYNLNIDCNDLSNTGITIGQEHNLEFKTINIKNFLNTGILTKDISYELMFNHIWIYGKGGTGLDINTNDSHYENILIIDCKNAINSNGFNFYEKIHAWIITPSLLRGSVFCNVIKSAMFNMCYCDTYEKGFYLKGNNNFSIQNCHYFCKEEGIYTSDNVDNAPTFIYTDNESFTAGLLVNGCIGKPLYRAINGSFGNFTNVTNYKGVYNENKFEKYKNIPIGITNSLIIKDGLGVTTNRLIKKNGRVLCEAKISKSPKFTEGNIIVATFPDNFKPKFDKSFISFIGYEWGFITPVYTYIHKDRGIEINIPSGLGVNPTHVHLSFEYDTDNYCDDILLDLD